MKEILLGDVRIPIKDYYCTDSGDVLEKTDDRLWLYVNLTDICNAACPFCINPGRRTGESPFDLARFQNVLTRIRDHMSGVSLTGGEPMLCPELIDGVIDAVNREFGAGALEIDLVTNGYRFREITKLKNLKYLDSVHLSRHAISDEMNDRLLNFESVKAEEVAEIIDSLEDPGKIVLNCLLIRDRVDSAGKAAEYMDLAISMGVRTVSFIGMSRCNIFCEEHYVDPALLGLEEDERFRFWFMQRDHAYCSCAGGVYEGRQGTARFYYRSVGSGKAPYCRQLVYTADNRLLAGFGGEEIRLGGPGPKKYKVGMYGGKFLPFHKGHRYCVETAARECEKVYVILFYDGAEEEEIRDETPGLWLSVSARTAQLKRICEECGSLAEVIPARIDTWNLRKPDGTDDWDAETPLVRAIVGDHLDAGDSSEESYGAYFSRAYPEAVHRLVDVKRVRYPISGEEIRRMESEEERRMWMV